MKKLKKTLSKYALSSIVSLSAVTIATGCSGAPFRKPAQASVTGSASAPNTTALTADEMQLANTLFKNQASIVTALASASLNDPIAFQSGNVSVAYSDGVSSDQYSFTVVHCSLMPTCNTLGTLNISTSTMFSPGGPISHTHVTFAANTNNNTQ
jgi:hypothetical protein